MAINPIGINLGTQEYVRFEDDGGTINTQIIDVRQGTVTLSNPSGTVVTVDHGTINAATISSLPNLPQGSIQVTAGTEIVTNGSIVVTASTISSMPNMPGGTINVATVTLGTLPGVGTVSNIGSVTNLGTTKEVTTVANITNGSIVVTTGTIAPHAITAATITEGTLRNLISGTINAATAVLNSGTINVATAVITTLPNLPQGSITVTVGTVGGKAASGAAAVANPILIAGTDSGGTIYAPLVTSAGALSVTGAAAGTFVNLTTGTLNVGTINTGTVVGKDANAAAQTGNPIAIGGTDTGGTVRTVLVDSGGAMKVSGASAGTFVNLTTGTLNVGTINTGTVVGKDANAAAQSGNPIAIGGTDTGGTIRTVLVDSGGAMKVSGASAGTFVNLSTGTLNAGTINAATIVEGTLRNLISGTINSATAVLNSGTINVATAVITTLPNLPQGSINVTAGTVSTGTINTGTINAGTINTGTITVGTVYKGVGAAAAGSLTAAGTITVAGSQNDAVYYDIGGTWVGTAFFEGQVGTSAFFAVPAMTPLGVLGTSTTGNGDYLVSAAGLDSIRLRVTYSSGTLTHNERASNFYSPLAYLMGGTLANVGTITNLISGTINSATVAAHAITAATVTAGTVNVATVTAGTVNVATVSAGTINTGTVNTGTINTGTINLGSVGGLAGSAAAVSGNPVYIGGQGGNGTLYPILTDTTGKQLIVMTVGTVAAGTVAVSAGTGIVTTGTVNTGTINVATVTAGTVNVATITEGTLRNLISGTINAATVVLNNGTINVGTFVGNGGSMISYGPAAAAAAAVGNPLNVGGTDAGGTIRTIRVDSNGFLTVNSVASGTTIGTINTGTVNTGTINVATVTAGTVNVATITAGTINAGTIKNDGRPARNILSYGTTFAVTSGSAWATLVGSASVGAGTSLWVNEVSVNNPAGSASLIVGFGTELTAGTNILLKGTYGTQGVVGHQKVFPMPVNCGMTNKDLTLYVGVPGTVDVNVSYFISA